MLVVPSSTGNFPSGGTLRAIPTLPVTGFGPGLTQVYFAAAGGATVSAISISASPTSHNKHYVTLQTLQLNSPLGRSCKDKQRNKHVSMGEQLFLILNARWRTLL